MTMRFARLLPAAGVSTKRNQPVSEASPPAPDMGVGPRTVRSNDRTPIMTKLFIAASLAALVASPVQAADMIVKAPTPPPAYSWEGLYVGGNVGWLGIEGVSL